MIFDGKIFKITGASDHEDGSMFNGLIALFEYKEVDLEHFIEWNNFTDKKTRYVRHPYGTKYLFSRDQYLCLSAGMKKQMPANVWENWIDGKDLLSPANKGHTLRCKGKRASWFQNLWLKAEILFHAKFTPLDEPNQLIAMMMVAGPEYLKLWVKHNKEWARSIRKYWYTEDGHWRNEPELAEFVIQKIESMTK